jgi:hypothetical protein
MKNLENKALRLAARLIFTALPVAGTSLSIQRD